MLLRRLAPTGLSLLLAISCAAALPPSPAAQRATGDYVPPEISSMTRPQSSELRELVERFVADRDEILRFYDVADSALQIRRMREFYAAWRKRLDEMAYDTLGTEGRVDWLLLVKRLEYEQRLLDREESRGREMEPL